MVEQKIQSMLFDVVQEVQAQAETFISSRLNRVEGEAEEQKWGLRALSDDANERLGKLQQYALVSVLESVFVGICQHAEGVDGDVDGECRLR